MLAVIPIAIGIGGVRELLSVRSCVSCVKFQLNFLESFAYFSDQAEKQGVAHKPSLKSDPQSFEALRNIFDLKDES